MKYRNIFGIVALLALAGIPIIVAQAQGTTRAQDILNRNADRNADIADRDALRLQEIDQRFADAYATRIIPQVDAATADMRAVIIPITDTLNNITDRMNNVVTVLQDVNIPLSSIGSPDQGIVGFDVQQKFDNFLGCYIGADLDGALVGCDVYDVPAGSVAIDPSGLQLLAEQPQSAGEPFLHWLNELSPAPLAAQPVFAGNDNWDLTHAGLGYASGALGEPTIPANQPAAPFLTAFEIEEANPIPVSGYLALREDALLEHVGPLGPGGSTTFADYGISPSMYRTIEGWVANTYNPSFAGNVLGLECGDETCEFTDASVFEIAVQFQLAKIRNNISLLEGSLINIRQALRAFIHDVNEAVQNYQVNLAPYDPTGGQDPFNVQDRQGAN